MVRPFPNMWLLGTGYPAARWRKWLDHCRAPALERWAESREQLDPKTLRMVRAYRLPMLLPPPADDDETREAVFALIRENLAISR